MLELRSTSNGLLFSKMAEIQKTVEKISNTVTFNVSSVSSQGSGEHNTSELSASQVPTLAPLKKMGVIHLYAHKAHLDSSMEQLKGDLSADSPITSI